MYHKFPKYSAHYSSSNRIGRIVFGTLIATNVYMNCSTRVIAEQISNTPPQARIQNYEIRPDQIGTGFAISQEKILTVAHGVRDCQAVNVVPQNHAPIQADKVEIDQQLDLAIISAHLPDHFSALPIRRDADLADGDHVFMVGFPLQIPLHRPLHSFVETFVTGDGGIDGDPRVYRLGFIAIPGMSGAAVLDNSGQVVGIIKSHLIAQAPNSGPTFGGQTFATHSKAMLNFLQDHGATSIHLIAPEIMSSQDIAKRATASSVVVLCIK